MNNDTFKILDSYLNKNLSLKIDCENSPISVNHYVSSILQFIINAFKPKIAIELGTLYGKSAIIMAKTNRSLQIHSIENNKNHYDIALQNIKNNNLNNQINLYFGDCMETLNTDYFQNLKADMIFIDANKAKYFEYLIWAEKFLAPHGIIVTDNIFIHKVQEKYQNPENNIHKNMELFLERVQNKDLFNTLIIPYERDGLAISIKKENFNKH